MTASIPENGLRARLHRLARGSVILAIALGMSGLGATSALAADESDSEDATPIELHLSIGTRGTIAPGSATSASVTVQNDSRTRLSSGRVTIEINRTPLVDQSAVTGWLEDAEAAGTFDEIGSDTTAAVDPESTVSSSLYIPIESLGELTPGVYPVRATLSGAEAAGSETDDSESDGSDDATSTTVLVITDAPPAPTAVLVPVTATPAGGALLTADELNALTADDGELTALLEAVRGTSAVLAIDPSIPAAIRVLGSAAPDRAVEWLDQLGELPNERFALQFGDADATTQAQGALPALLQPTTLAPFLDPNNFTGPQATPTPTPTSTPATSSTGTETEGDSEGDAETENETKTPTPSPTPLDGPVLPDDASLTAVDGAIPGILWSRGDVSDADLAAFGAYLGAEATSILPSSSVSGAVGGRATVGGMDVLVTDTAASDALSKAANENDPALRQGWLAQASAHLYLSGQTSAGAPLLVGLHRDETRTADALREAIVSVDTPGFVLSSLLGSPAAQASLSTEPDTTRGAALQGMLQSEVVLAEFATILEDTQLLLSPKRIQIMRATAVGLSAKGFETAVDDVDDATRDTLDAVDIPPAATIQLLSANADLPFSVRNDLPWPVTVNLAVSPSDPRLEVQSNTPATVLAGTTSRVKVPVSARVGSGELNLKLTLSSPTGVQIGEPEIVRVAVRAEWETIGLGVFGGLIVILLGLGIIRTVRRKRRDAAHESSDSENIPNE